jgi:GNAT superfamily N-acetyltransferase
MSGRALRLAIERDDAAKAASLALVLAEQDPVWGSEAHPLAGGQLVLSGPGLYVNRGLALGLEAPVVPDELDFLEARSRAVGVRPAVEVTELSDPGTRDLLDGRGYAADNDGAVTVLVRTTDDLPSDHDPAISIVPVGQVALDQWIETSALGWGHLTEPAQRAASAYARAAYVIDGSGMVVARDSVDGRPLGCASLTVAGPIATLGGMSTIPTERGRGVQSALIRYRLAAARGRGCQIATSSARIGGASERNLIRHGFEPIDTRRSYFAADPAAIR